LVADLAVTQSFEEVLVKGPPVAVAYDDEGNLAAAGQAFAKKYDLSPDELETTETDKGEWLIHRQSTGGKPVDSLIPETVEVALTRLPIPRRMRWGKGEAEFVRPVHWLVMLHGTNAVDASLFGLRAGQSTYGHRFHAPGEIRLSDPSDYLSLLESARVIADFHSRRKKVVCGVREAATAAGGVPIGTEALYDEVTSLCEWPVPLVGAFDESFLTLPREVIVATLTNHQRYFPIADEDGSLLPYFVTVANLESRDPGRVRHGNERVIRPRLADAAFFWETDSRTPLADRRLALAEVVYQRGLGSMRDKSDRTGALAAMVASESGADADSVQRAASLAKCDLLTGMVGEFPELQGVMGRHYAAADGEASAVAEAIGEQYLPRFAGDSLPQTAAGQALAIADKLDTLAGIFTLGKKPTGNRDPFGLRRAALGVVRIVIEQELDLNLRALVTAAVAAQPRRDTDEERLSQELYDFITERMRGYYLDRQNGLTAEMFAAVLARRPDSLLDFDERLKAVAAFVKLEPASSLAAANKRIGNILKQAGVEGGKPVNESLITEPAEEVLFDSVSKAREAVTPLLENRDYTSVLTTLASLRDPVDGFFDDVMVMTEDRALRNNRLALLTELRAMFLDVADISRLSIG
jgi:glycyl-tRNA synthetase beta chain